MPIGFDPTIEKNLAVGQPWYDVCCPEYWVVIVGFYKDRDGCIQMVEVINEDLFRYATGLANFLKQFKPEPDTVWTRISERDVV